MSRERHRRIAEIFRAACELDAAERDAYLARECDDDALRAEVLELLAHDDRPHPGLSESGQQRGALSLKARIQWRWADVVRRRGVDPRPDLDRAIDLAKAALDSNSQISSAHQNLAAANRLLGSWQMLRGINPVPALERAIAAAGAAIELQPNVAIGYNSLGNANVLLARYQVSRGEDPEKNLG